jgi:hypothetical protein
MANGRANVEGLGSVLREIGGGACSLDLRGRNQGTQAPLKAKLGILVAYERTLGDLNKPVACLTRISTLPNSGRSSREPRV